MGTTFLDLSPVLQARNVPDAIAYYVDRLGFELRFRDDETQPRYAGVRRHGVEFHLQWHDESSFQPERGDALMVRIRVVDPDALFAEYAAKGVFGDHTAVRDTTRGTREFGFYDLNGHGLTFYRAR